MEAKNIPTYELGAFIDLIEKSPDILAEHPCLITGFVEQWPAYTQWNRHAALQRLFGHLPVTAGAPQFVTNAHSRMCQVRTTFGDYLEYVNDPARLSSLFHGCWIKGDESLFRELDLPLYCGNLQLVRHAASPVLKDLSPLLPGSLACFNDEIPYYYQSGNHVWLYVSLAGALTPLHQDNNAVIAYLAQIRGCKEAILYSPEDKAHFYNPDVGYLDPLAPDETFFPTWREARPWTGSLAAGDLLIWGPQWAHHVVTRSDSITVSFDIVNQLNLQAYADAMDWRAELGLFARKQADLVRSRVDDEDVLGKLDQGPVEELGCALMICVLRAALKGEATARSRHVKEQLLQYLADCEVVPV
ncbi:cupin-like domain-containing protein [Oleiagrimonas sp. MCCC 1A03011]|jgi:hypothetical protein|uniref:cupin-like domain-containing protein n=1 Tax=Oleiagrimonas sp. MCCC 1A03011 TaxID=1926883 RepID=UPI00143DC898|nr:cupin-like domain-containing protein [Oleiagrimonas sp. MCCC 1A03011]